MLLVGTAGAQITSVGLIGTATPGGWDFDTDMVQDTANADMWTLAITLTDGVVKFRADDDWAINWGNDEGDFPYGTGAQDAADIPVKAGDYNIQFNSATGVYYFDFGSAIGIIGSATPFGWDSDTDMCPDTGDVYTITLDLNQGEVKFRMDNDWAVNWGAEGFPTDTGVQNGPNIPIEVPGNYSVTFDTASGVYNFTQNLDFTTVGIIGDATPAGWDSATAMNPGSGVGDWTITADLTAGGLQFSGDNGVVVWGGSDFPSGTAVENGDTIPVPEGTWIVDFNHKTGEYSFTIVEIFASVGIIGDATPGGWDTDTDMERSPTDSSEWTLRIELTDGEAKFRANDDWAVNWGAGDFPTGVAVRDGANIPITAGEYVVSFNSIFGNYNFRELIVFDTMGLIGTGTPFGDWDNDVIMTRDPSDENSWFIEEITLSDAGADGGVKFRADRDWTVNWGADSWPNGIGTQDGPNIPSVAGTYGITFNDATGEYAFGDPITSSNRELLRPSSIKAYPNPTADLLNVDVSAVEMTGDVQMRVYDMNGKLLVSQTQAAQDLMQLDVAALPNGIYSLQITSEGYIIGKRFVVARK
ncbi:MAG: SusF/SusE family outer membrane protein [Saprospiraceae bacterium]|nr:SusF/SusE family outer membrane protein [Saprospiraceae bacterium]